MKTPSELINSVAHPLTGSREDYAPLLERIGDARIVLLGAQTHGTHEFHRERAQITRKLITEKAFNAVAVEADWPDAYRVNRYVRGQGQDTDALQALGGFASFPAWIWRNADSVDFIGWLRAHNDSLLSSRGKVGFYGLDLYGLHKSIDAILDYLDRMHPEAAREARVHYGCFDHIGKEPHRYGLGARLGLVKSCEGEAVMELHALRRRRAELLLRDGPVAEEELFSAEQNALLVENAEQYYRAIFGERVTAWNIRDRHMSETLRALAAHLEKTQPPGKIVVWAHNLHVGDSRATESILAGRTSLGRLVREHYGRDAVLTGFTTDSGTVTAATEWWGSPPQRIRLKPALQESYESLFHQARPRRFLLNLCAESDAIVFLRSPRLERAVGVVHSTDLDRDNAYFKTRMPDQFDAVIHIDETRAVEPLEHSAEWEKGEFPETFPTGI